jgi:hypothetical protein
VGSIERQLKSGPRTVTSAVFAHTLGRGRRPIPALRHILFRRNNTMRAEIQTIVDEIKQSVGLLRRHL